MKFIKILIWVLLFMLVCLGAQAAPVTKIAPGDALPFAEDAELLYVYFFDIGLRDSFLVLCGGESMLIDCGTYSCGPQVSERLEMLGITHIDYALNTHPHDDHIDGYRSLSDDITITNFMTCYPLNENQNQIDAIEYMRKKGVNIIQFTEQDDISFGGNSIWLNQNNANAEINTRSLVMNMSFGDASVLFMADVYGSNLEQLAIKYPHMLKTDIIKLPHHGLTVPTAGFLRAAAPEICVLTNYRNDKTALTLEVLELWKHPVVHSSLGMLEFVTDGAEWVYRQYPQN